MEIPEIAASKLQDAFDYFDKQLRDSSEWSNWEQSGHYRFAVETNGKRYPIDHIVLLATAISAGQLEKSDEAKEFLEARQYAVISLTGERNSTGFSIWLRELVRLRVWLLPTIGLVVILAVIIELAWTARLGYRPVGSRLAAGFIIGWLAVLEVRRRGMFISPRDKSVDTTVPCLKKDILNAGGNANGGDTLLELLKLEYEKGIGRHEDIYKAIWQNFSYMSVIAGGVLTFGFKQLNPEVLPFLTLTPLVFWFLATFLPMDYYGQQARTRLGKIEDQFSNKYFAEGGFQHFREFAKTQYRWRVGDIVRVFGVFACLCWIIAAVFATDYLFNKHITGTHRLIGSADDATTLSVAFRSDSASNDSIKIALTHVQALKHDIQQRDSTAAYARLQSLDARVYRSLDSALHPPRK